MMGEHGGRKKKAKKAKPAKASDGGRDWAGCGAPSILTLAIVIVVVVVFRNEFGHLLIGLFQQLTGR